MVRSKPLLIRLLALSAFSVFLGCTKSLPKEDVVAQVGESVLTKETLRAMLPTYSIKDSASVVRQAIERWAHRELLYRAAVQKGLHKDVVLDNQLEDYRKTLYGTAYVDLYLSNKILVTTDEVRDYYKKHRELFRRRSHEVKLVHFLLKSREEALKVKRALLRYEGAVRQELLSSHHVEVRSVSQGDMIPDLDKALFKFPQPRGVVGPIRSRHGYHVVEVLDAFPAKSYRGLDEVYDEISQQIYRQESALVYEHLLDSLQAVYPLKTTAGFLDPQMIPESQ